MNPFPRYVFIGVLAALAVIPLLMLQKEEERSSKGRYVGGGSKELGPAPRDGSNLFLGSPKPAKRKTHRLQPIDQEVFEDKDSVLEDAPSDGYQYQFGITYGRRCGRFSLAGRVFPAKQSGEWIVRRLAGGDSRLPTSTLQVWQADSNGNWDAYDVGPLAGGEYELRIFDPKGHLRTVGQFVLDECSGGAEESQEAKQEASSSPSPSRSPSASPSRTGP